MNDIVLKGEVPPPPVPTTKTKNFVNTRKRVRKNTCSWYDKTENVVVTEIITTTEELTLRNGHVVHARRNVRTHKTKRPAKFIDRFLYKKGN